jgi:hypothetical protein
MIGWQRERIVNTYTRKVMAHPEGKVVHDADCGIYNAELGICTCGLHHCLMACSSEDIDELYPKYHEEKSNEGIIAYMLQQFEAENLYVKDKEEYVKVERPEPISKEEADKIINKIFKKKDKNDDKDS